jgi:general secretion pathway protein F
MEVFDYTALGADGRAVTGRLEAPDRRAAARRLQEAGQFPMELRSGTATSTVTAAAAPDDRPLKGRELARLARSLALLLGAGLPLDAAIEALAESERSSAPRALLRALLAALRSGSRFSAALAARPRAIPRFFVAAVAAAEGTGQLPNVLDRLAQELLRTEHLQERLRAGLTYPAVVLVMAALAIGVLVSVVLPALEPLFSAAGGRLPASTRAMLDAAAWLREAGAPSLAALLALLLLARRALAAAEARRWRDARLLRLPLLGPLAWRSATARFARPLAMLLSAGVPLPEALGHAAAATGNAAVGAGLLRAGARLAAGERFAAALAKEAALPRLAITLIDVGEEGGRLREMLEEVALIHEEEAERATERLLVLLVPGVTLLLGGVVAGIVLATLDAILGANAAALGGGGG